MIQTILYAVRFQFIPSKLKNIKSRKEGCFRYTVFDKVVGDLIRTLKGMQSTCAGLQLENTIVTFTEKTLYFLFIFLFLLCINARSSYFCSVTIADH